MAQADIVISTALIPGRPAPVLITEEMVKSMKPGSVIVDMAAPAGRQLPVDRAGQTVTKHGVTLVGETNLPATVAADAVGALRAQRARFPEARSSPRKATCTLPMDDDIVAACLVTRRTAKSMSRDSKRHGTTGERVEIVSPTVINLIIFVLAIYVGYHVVWNVTPALHTPLMA